MCGFFISVKFSFFLIKFIRILTNKMGVSGCITDEKAMIKLLGHRNAAQRKNIGDTYQELYNQSLIDSLNSKLSGDFGVCCFLHLNI